MASSRTAAQSLIECRKVLVGGSLAAKSSRLVSAGEAVVVTGDAPRYVSRGGVKLEVALQHFGIAPTGRRALDIGASTGGFTDCLLQHGAAEVVALDVGRNQLHERLRGDPRVVSLERTDVRNVDVAQARGPFDLVVADLAFISLRVVASDVAALGSRDVIMLVKPQFEAGKAQADRGRGVIKDPEVWQQALTGVCDAYLAVGAAIAGVMVSPITGASGNVEFFVHADLRQGTVSGSQVRCSRHTGCHVRADPSDGAVHRAGQGGSRRSRDGSVQG